MYRTFLTPPFELLPLLVKLTQATTAGLLSWSGRSEGDGIYAGRDRYFLDLEPTTHRDGSRSWRFVFDTSRVSGHELEAFSCIITPAHEALHKQIEELARAGYKPTDASDLGLLSDLIDTILEGA